MPQSRLSAYDDGVATATPADDGADVDDGPHIVRPAYDADHNPYCPECVREHLDDAPTPPGETHTQHLDRDTVALSFEWIDDAVPVLGYRCPEHDLILPEALRQIAARREDPSELGGFLAPQITDARGQQYRIAVPATAALR